MRGDEIDQAIEQWREMERKAAAWDELRRLMEENGQPLAFAILETMDELVHPAQSSST